MTMTDTEINDRVSYHAPSQEGIKRHASLSQTVAETMKIVDSVCEGSREKSLALTKLEEAKFWASAAVARNPETR